MRELSRASSPKLLSYIILERITPYAENIIGDYQGGFRPNRSVTDQVFTLRMILFKYYETSKSVHQVFLDFRQAYDSINRKSLWFAFESLGIPKKLVQLCRMTVTQSQCCVKVENKLSGIFTVDSEFRQGLLCRLYSLISCWSSSFGRVKHRSVTFYISSPIKFSSMQMISV